MNFSIVMGTIVSLICVFIAGLAGLLAESFVYCMNCTPETVGLWYSVIHGIMSVFIFLVLLFAFSKALDQTTPPGGASIKHGL